jgi:cytochrome c-type biogenesis protein CcmH/NrfG
MVWHAEGQTKRATSTLGAVLAKDPRQQEAHYSLAIILFSQNDIAGAKAEWAAEPEPGSSN